MVQIEVIKMAGSMSACRRCSHTVFASVWRIFCPFKYSAMMSQMAE